MCVLKNRSGGNYCLEDVVQNVISFYYCICLLQISYRKYLQQDLWANREPDVPTLSLEASALCRHFFPSYFEWFPTCSLELSTCQLVLWCFWKEVAGGSIVMYSHTQYECFSSGFGEDLPYSCLFFRMSRFDCLTIWEVTQGDKLILSSVSGFHFSWIWQPSCIWWAGFLYWSAIAASGWGQFLVGALIESPCPTLDVRTYDVTVLWCNSVV